MNKRQQEQMVGFFQELYQTQELFDFIKLSLIQSPNYNPNLLFDLISERSQSISLQNMSRYLADKAACNDRQLYQIFERFDWSRQGQISRNDFLSQMAPFGTQGVSINHSGGTVSAQIEGHFISLFIEILKRFRILEVARKQIKYIQPYDAFQHIDYLKTGYLGITSLRKLFYDNDFNVTDKQLYYLLHGLRRRCYRNINLQVFCQNLDPMEFGEYLAFRNCLQELRQRQFANRSMNEQETIKRSRLQAQRTQHEFQKAQRKKQAELERQIELEDRVNVQILKHDQQQDRQIRRAMLQEDRDLRYGVATGVGTDFLILEQQRNYQERLENQYLNNLRLRQEEVNAALSNSGLKREQELQRSRRQMQLEKEAASREQIQKEKSLIRSAAVAREYELSRRRIEEQSRRRYEQENIKRITEQSRRRYEGQVQYRKRQEQSYQKLLEDSRKKIQESRRQQLEDNKRLDELRRKTYQTGPTNREKLYREIQLERQRKIQEISAIRNKHVPEYEKQLEQTRYDMRSRRTGDFSSSYK